MPACDSPAAGADRLNSFTLMKFGFLNLADRSIAFSAPSRDLSRVDMSLCQLFVSRLVLCLPCQHSQLYSPVSWLKKVQTKLCGLVFIDSQQKCIDFCKYASYLPAKLEAGACSPLSAPAAVVGRSLQQRDRRSEPRSSSAPKSRLQRRPRLAPPSNSPSAAPSVRSAPWIEW